MPEEPSPYERIMVSFAGIAAASEVYNRKLKDAYIGKRISKAEYNRQKQAIRDAIRDHVGRIDLGGDKRLVCFLYEDFAKGLLKDAQAFSPAGH